MIIHRWQAPVLPSLEQIKVILENEGLEPFMETISSGEKVTDHRHPFTEVRFVLEGELLFNIAGNQFLLRQGDRVEVPSNTKHSHAGQGSGLCKCVVAQKIA